MISFDELMRKFDVIMDIILTKMGYGKNIKYTTDQGHIKSSLDFSKHLYETKCWFVRLSWKNKKNFLLDLIDEVQELWTISLLLKSIWNSRPKDAILSTSRYKTWSGYDQVPIDHDRTVLSSSFKDIIISNREWFRFLDSEQQFLVLAELLSVAGGPIIWEVLKHSQKIYDHNLELQSENIKEFVVVHEPPSDKKIVNVEVTKKEQTQRQKSSATHILDSSTQPFITRQVQQELDTNLALWASAIKAIKDNLKLEELEITFKDDTKKKIWKVSRPKPEAIETVDFIQLLPSAIGKRILLHLPSTQLSECARVNKYWAFLVDEFRTELIARQKIDVELEKLRENMLRHDASLHLLDKLECTFNSSPPKTKQKTYVKNSRAYYLRLEMNKEKKRRIANPPFRNMADLNTRLDIRGAADRNIRKWCANICKMYRSRDGQEAQTVKIFKKQENFSFTSPYAPPFCVNVDIPLNPPLVLDPTINIDLKLEAKSRKDTTKEE